MSIKIKATTYSDYYASMKEAVSVEREDCILKREKVVENKNKAYKEIQENTEVYKDLGIDLSKYSEYNNNKYENGTFYRVAKGAFINRQGNYEATTDLYNLYQLAKYQKDEHDCIVKIKKYDKMLNLNGKEYNDICRTFYNEVARHLILYGEGYALEGKLGWLCINRCKLVNPRPKLDFAKTKARKKELLAEGQRLWNKEEQEWCNANGLEYDGVDYRVYKKDEYCYEIPLIACTLPNGQSYRFECTDYRGAPVRGKSNEDLAKECKDLQDVLKLPLDIKAKLSICEMKDKMLYLNFIRNENQRPCTYREANRKDR